MKGLRYAFVGALLILGQRIYAADTYTVLGQGNQSCGKWTQDSRDPNSTAAIADLVWVLGYVSAYNNYASASSGDVSSNTDVNGIEAWIDGYCANHPLDKIAGAAAELIIELKKRRLPK